MKYAVITLTLTLNLIITLILASRETSSLSHEKLSDLPIIGRRKLKTDMKKEICCHYTNPNPNPNPRFA